MCARTRRQRPGIAEAQMPRKRQPSSGQISLTRVRGVNAAVARSPAPSAPMRYRLVVHGSPVRVRPR